MTTGTFGGDTISFTHRRGEGTTVVLLTGCAMAAASWRLVTDQLPGPWLTYDRPGLGGTAWPGHPDLATEAQRVTDLVEREIGSPVVLVAHSMASFHAEAVALTRPELVAGIVLVDPSVEPDPWWARVPVGWLPRLLKVVLHLPLVPRIASWFYRHGVARQSLHPERADDAGWREPYRSPEAIVTGAAEWLSYPRQAADLNALHVALPRIDVPTIVLDAPRYLSARELLHLSSGFGAIQRLDVPDSSHIMMLDRPSAIIDAIVRIRGESGGFPGRE